MIEFQALNEMSKWTSGCGILLACICWSLGGKMSALGGGDRAGGNISTKLSWFLILPKCPRLPPMQLTSSNLTRFVADYDWALSGSNSIRRHSKRRFSSTPTRYLTPTSTILPEIYPHNQRHICRYRLPSRAQRRHPPPLNPPIPSTSTAFAMEYR